ncbi:MAG: tetratricopeptide repeat protein [Pyrinomonadaceae bacterium]
MKKETILVGVIGLMVGLIIGFMFANSVNQTSAGPAGTSSLAVNSNMPPGHPDIGSAGTGAMQPEITAAIEKAKGSPNDADAQAKAGQLYYQIGRYDEAVGFLEKANKLRPDDNEIMADLANANFDADNYEAAEKWYVAALAKKEDDVNLRTDLGLTFVFRQPPDYDRAIAEFRKSLATDPSHIQTLQNMTVAYTRKGDESGAKATLAKLEAVDPANAAISRLREDLAKLGTN